MSSTSRHVTVMLTNKDDSVTKENNLRNNFLIFDPLFMYPSDLDVNILKTLAATHPCGCTAETIYYSERRLFTIVWDREDLRSIGLPPPDAQTVIWPLKSYLPLRILEANPRKTNFPQVELKRRMRKFDYRKQIDLFDTFIKLTGTPKEIEIRWSRRQHHPRFRAYMVGMLFRVAKEHQKKYTTS